MATTQISNVIVPIVFTKYLKRYFFEKSALIRSGIVRNIPELMEIITGGGKLINMPFWQELTGDDEVLSDTTPMTPKKITASTDVAVRLERGSAWSTMQLAAALAGSDPMTAIISRVGDFWIRMEQKVLLSELSGVFANTLASHMLDISGSTGDAAIIDANSILDAKQLLGDAADQLVALAMHSATLTKLQKDNLITYIPDSEGHVHFPTYLGYEIIVDDAMPVSGGVYTTYLFARRAFGRAEGTPVGLPAVMVDTDVLAREEYLTHTRSFVMHPMGIKFTNNTVAGSTPSNAELATAANWQLVYESKAVGLAALKHKLA